MPATAAPAEQRTERQAKHTQHQPKATDANTPDKQPVQRTSAGLRDALFDEMDLLRRGRGDPQRASAIAKLAAHIIMAAKLEIQFGAISEDRGDGRPPIVPRVFELGRQS